MLQAVPLVAGGIVGKTNLDSVPGELMRVCSTKAVVARDLWLYKLADDVLICDTHDKAVLGRIVFVLILDRHTTPGLVVRLPLAPSAVLYLRRKELSPWKAEKVFRERDGFWKGT